MNKRGNGKRGREGFSRWGATLAALLIVAAQLLALAHYHRTSGPARYAAPTRTAAADQICGLCELVLHAPLNLAAAPAINRPRWTEASASNAARTNFASAAHSHFLTRAPPFPA